MQKRKKKTKDRVQTKIYIETYTIPNCLYTSKPTKRGREKAKK